MVYITKTNLHLLHYFQFIQLHLFSLPSMAYYCKMPLLFLIIIKLSNAKSLPQTLLLHPIFLINTFRFQQRNSIFILPRFLIFFRIIINNSRFLILQNIALNIPHNINIRRIYPLLKPNKQFISLLFLQPTYIQQLHNSLPQLFLTHVKKL